MPRLSSQMPVAKIGSGLLISLSLLGSSQIANANPFEEMVRSGDLEIQHQRNHPELKGRAYAYAPALFYDQDRKRYINVFCGEWAGDYLYGAAAARLEDVKASKQRGILVNPNAKSYPQTYNHAACDPSMIKYKGQYYVYYTATGKRLNGKPNDLDSPFKSGILVARSNQPLSGFRVLRRERRDRNVAIVRTTSKTYGVGQPAVVYAMGQFYMFYTDQASNDNQKKNHIVVIKADNPEFRNHREVKRIHVNDLGTSIDVAFDPNTKEFLITDNYKGVLGNYANAPRSGLRAKDLSIVALVQNDGFFGG